VFSFGIYGASILSFNEFSHRNICPTILNIPACYIILICLVIPLIVHVIKAKNIVYFIFTGLAWCIVFYGSVMQFSGYIECPKTNTNVPMCYISLLLFSALIFLKLMQQRKLKK